MIYAKARYLSLSRFQWQSIIYEKKEISIQRKLKNPPPSDSQGNPMNYNILIAIVLIAAISAVASYIYLTRSPAKPNPGSNSSSYSSTQASNSTPISNGNGSASSCFNIPAYPSRNTIIAFVSEAESGSGCAEGAVRLYYSEGLLAKYNISTSNLTSILDSSTGNSVTSTSSTSGRIMH